MLCDALDDVLYDELEGDEVCALAEEDNVPLLVDGKSQETPYQANKLVLVCVQEAELEMGDKLAWNDA